MEKMFYTMGEVSEMFDLKQPTIRFWCKEFPCLKPKRSRNKNNRIFTPEDVETLKLIYHLVKEQGMKLSGARKVIDGMKFDRQNMSQGMSLLDRLQNVRSMILSLQAGLGDVGSLEEELDQTSGLEDNEIPEVYGGIVRRKRKYTRHASVQETADEASCDVQNAELQQAEEPEVAEEQAVEQELVQPVQEAEAQKEASQPVRRKRQSAVKEQKKEVKYVEQTLF